MANSNAIRNLNGFMKSYLSSESATRALNRSVKLIDKTTEDSKHKVIHYKEFAGGNQLAHAMKAAFA